MKYGIVTQTEEFMGRLTEALGILEPEKYTFFAFPNIEKAKTAARKKQINGILCDLELAGNEDLEDCPVPLLLLTETKEEENPDLPAPRYCKYRTCRDWNQLLQDHKDMRPPVIEKRELKNMILFTSAAGGTGTSTAALAFAQYCAKHRCRVVYLCFDAINMQSSILSPESMFGMDDYLSAVRNDQYDLRALIKRIIVRDEETGIYTVPPCKMPQDTMCMSGEEITELCRQVSGTMQDGIIVVDMKMDSSRNFALPAIMAQYIVLVLDGEQIANQKTMAWYRIFPNITDITRDELNHKTRMLYNRYRQKSGELIRDLPLGKLGGINLRDENDPKKLVRELARLDPIIPLGESIQERRYS